MCIILGILFLIVPLFIYLIIRPYRSTKSTKRMDTIRAFQRKDAIDQWRQNSTSLRGTSSTGPDSRPTKVRSSNWDIFDFSSNSDSSGSCGGGSSSDSGGSSCGGGGGGGD